MLEGALDKVKSTWEHYDDQMKECMDEIVALQCQCLNIEQQCLGLEARAQGMSTEANSAKTGAIRIVLLCTGITPMMWYILSRCLSLM